MPVALFVLAGIFVFFLLLLSLRIKLIFTVREEMRVTLALLCFRFSLFPRKITPRKALRKYRKERRKSAKKEKKKAPTGHAVGKEKTAEKSEKASLLEKIAGLRAVLALLVRKTGKHLHLRTAKLHIAVATGDAASTAILCGAVSQSVAYILALLDRVTNLHTKPREVSVFPDYLSDKSRVDIRFVFSLRVAGAFALLFSFVLAYLRTKAQNKRKTRRSQKAAERNS